jgi:threonine/homoserine/homoserine lactone efflux protein
LNVKQALIITTEDRVRIHLSNHLSKVEKRKGWIAPSGILLSIIVTLITAKFKDGSIIFSASTWEAIFVIAGILCFGWLIYAGWQAWKSESIDDLIERLKRESK